MPSCAVVGCNRSTKHNKKLPDNEKLSFFTFPKDKKLAKTWWTKCKRKDKKKYNKNDTVCSLHFLPNDFKKSIAEEYGLLCKKRTLQKNAVPSLNLPKTRSKKTIPRTTFTSKW